MSMRFTMKPGTSLLAMTVFPIFWAIDFASSYVSFDVCTARMISMSFIRGGGFMKCIPMTRSGRFVAPASLVIEIDDVFAREERVGLLERLVALTKELQLQIDVLRRRFDDEITLSEICGAIDGDDAFTIAIFMSALTLAFSTCFWSIASMRARPFSATSSDASASRTSYPAVAATCAIPPPICPAPRHR